MAVTMAAALTLLPQVALVSIPLIGDPDHTQARRGLDRLRTASA